MARFTGLSTSTPDELLLDSGVFLKGEYRTKAAVLAAIGTANCLGATNGGGTFAAVPTVRQAQVDGGVTNIKDLEVIDDWVVTMTANVKSQTVNNIKLALGAAIVDTTTDTGYTTITGGTEFADSDYTDITWAGKLNGHSNPVIIILHNAVSLNGFNLSVADKDEATVAITLTGHYDLSDLDTAPFEILFPNADTTSNL